MQLYVRAPAVPARHLLNEETHERMHEKAYKKDHTLSSKLCSGARQKFNAHSRSHCELSFVCTLLLHHCGHQLLGKPSPSLGKTEALHPAMMCA